MTYEVRPLSFAELLDTSFRMCRTHFRPLLGLVVVTYAPVALLNRAAHALPSAFDPTGPPSVGGAGVAHLAYALLVPHLIVALVWPVAAAAVMHAVGAIYLGRATAIGQSLRLATSILVSLVGTFVLSDLLVLGGMLLVLPGLYLMLAYLLVVPVMVFEQVFGMAALRRSRALMRNCMFRGAGIVAIYQPIAVAPIVLFHFALHARPVVAFVAVFALKAASFAFFCTVSTVLYFDIRCRKEAFDLEHLADLVAQRAPSPAPA